MPTLPVNPLRQKAYSRHRILVSNVGYRLKYTRLRKRLSVMEVSAATGLHHKAIERMETGGHSFSFSTAIILAVYYHISFHRLVKCNKTPPTLREWKQLDLMQKQLSRYLKSKKRKLPQTGMQLVLGF